MQQEIKTSLLSHFTPPTISLTLPRISTNPLTESLTNVLPTVLTNARRHSLCFGYLRSEPLSYVLGWRLLGDKGVGGTNFLAVTSSDSGSIQQWQCLRYSNKAGFAALSYLCWWPPAFAHLILLLCQFWKLTNSLPTNYSTSIIQGQFLVFATKKASWYTMVQTQSHLACLRCSGTRSDGQTRNFLQSPIHVAETL